jgi:hypothetical protein
MTEPSSESAVGFRVDPTFGPFSEFGDYSLVYQHVENFCDAVLQPEYVTGLGKAMLRWMYLHASYRLGFGKPFVLDVPSPFLSLAGGLVVFLSVYFRTHKITGDEMLAACEAWVVTIRKANQEAHRIREESLRKN